MRTAPAVLGFAPRKLLVIRRDNIGDLVCTTPLLRSLRQKYPEARIDALVTSYNEPILENNPDVDYVYAYTKAKQDMFFYTSTAEAPWVIVKSDDKKRARLNAMQYFLSAVPYPDKNLHVVRGPDPLIVGSSAAVLGQDPSIYGSVVHPDMKKSS